MTIVNTGVERPRRGLGNAWIWIVALGGPMAAVVLIDWRGTAVAIVAVAAYGVVSLACFAVGVRVYRPVVAGPWVAFGPAIGLFVLAVLAFHFISRSVAAVITLAWFCCYLIGLILAVRATRPRPGRGAIVDAALLSLAVLAVEWKVILDGFSLGAASFVRLVVVVFWPVMAAAVLALTLSLLFRAGSIRSPAAALLLSALGLIVFSVSVGVIVGPGGPTGWAGLSAWGNGFLAATALHPTMRDLFTQRSQSIDVGAVRFVLVAAAPIVPAVLLVWDIAAHGSARSPVLPLLTALSFVLSGIRIADLLTWLRRAARRDAALRRYADGLAVAEDRSQALQATERAARELLGCARVRLVPAGAAASAAAAAPVNLENGERYELVAEGSSVGVTRTDDVLTVIASGLEAALSRLAVRERERAAAEALREQNARLIQLNEVKRSFVSMVSHELRTPLTSIVGYLEFLRDGDAGELTDEQANYVSVMERNAGRLQKLVDDILQLGRADEGRMKLTVEQVDAAQLVRRAAESAGPVAEQNGLTLTVEVAPELPDLAGDRRLLAQALDNLVSNALKFTPAGGAVTIRVRPAEEGIELEVQDSGVGIPADELPHLFERFFRGSTAVASGTGLGLPIAQSIADLHGGTISVDSTVGVGATFALRLPLAPPAIGRLEETETLEA